MCVCVYDVCHSLLVAGDRYSVCTVTLVYDMCVCVCVCVFVYVCVYDVCHSLLVARDRSRVLSCVRVCVCVCVCVCMTCIQCVFVVRLFITLTCVYMHVMRCGG